MAPDPFQSRRSFPLPSNVDLQPLSGVLTTVPSRTRNFLRLSATRIAEPFFHFVLTRSIITVLERKNRTLAFESESRRVKIEELDRISLSVKIEDSCKVYLSNVSLVIKFSFGFTPKILLRHSQFLINVKMCSLQCRALRSRLHISHAFVGR